MSEPKVGEWWWVQRDDDLPSCVVNMRVSALTPKCIKLSFDEKEDEERYSHSTYWYARKCVEFIEPSTGRYASRGENEQAQG